MTRHAYPFAALAIALALPARAGLVLQYEDGEKKQTTMELDGKKFRSVREGGRHGGETTIFDGDKQVLYSLEPETKTYRRMDEASTSQMTKGMKESMDKAMAKMTPEQRAQMEAYRPKQQPASGEKDGKESWKFERAGGSQKVAGYSCDNYRVLRDGKPDREGCFIPWGAGPFKKDDFQAFKEMGRFLQKTLGSMSAGLGQGQRAARSEDRFTGYVDAAPGFPAVMDRVAADGTRKLESRLVKAGRTSIAADHFVPPADYKEKPMPMGPGKGAKKED